MNYSKNYIEMEENSQIKQKECALREFLITQGEIEDVTELKVNLASNNDLPNYFPDLEDANVNYFAVTKLVESKNKRKNGKNSDIVAYDEYIEYYYVFQGRAEEDKLAKAYFKQSCDDVIYDRMSDRVYGQVFLDAYFDLQDLKAYLVVDYEERLKDAIDKMLESIICIKDGYTCWSTASVFNEEVLDRYFIKARDYFIESNILTVEDYAVNPIEYYPKIKSVKDLSKVSWFPRHKMDYLLKMYKEHIKNDYASLYDWICEFLGNEFTELAESFYLNRDYVVSLLLECECLDLDLYYDTHLKSDMDYKASIFSDGWAEKSMEEGYLYKGEVYYIYNAEG